MIIALAALAWAGRASSAGLWSRCPFPLPGCIIDAIPAHPASEHIIGIYLSNECLAGRSLHPQFALRCYISLKVQIERREPRNPVTNSQNRCNPIIGALRSRG